MSKKLSKKERGETVTKGYLNDYLDIRLKQQSQELRDHVDVLIEHQTHQLETFFEGLDDRYVLRREWEAAK